jgi:hypothetical protein
MNKKKIIVGIFILVIVAIVGTLYIIDLNRMKNDEPVFFSTWGYKYAPSIKKEETKTNEYTFLGRVIDTLGIYEEVSWVKDVPGSIQITIEPLEGEEIRKTTDKIVIYLKEYDGNSYEAGTIVKVTYTGEVLKSDPPQVNYTKIEEVKNYTVEMYKKILDDLINQDSAINEGAKFIAIDFTNFLAYHKDGNDGSSQLRNLSTNEKNQLLDYCKKYNENVIEATMEELKEKGYFNEKNMYLQGILITVTNTEKVEFDKAILSLQKYRGGLAAVFPKYEVTLVDNDYWTLQILDMAIS